MADNATADENKPEEQPAAMEAPIEVEVQTAGESEAAPASDADANALLDMIAEAAGVDKATAISVLTDKLEEIVAIAKKSAEQDGTAAEMAAPEKKDDAPDAALAMSTRVAHLEAAIAAMKADRDALLAEKKQGAESKAKAEQERIVAMVDQRIADGYILDSAREQAIKLFTADEQAAAAMFSHKVVPTGGEMQAGSEPDKSKAPGAAGALAVNEMSAYERAMFACLRGAGDSTDKAARRITKMRAEKGVN